MTNVCSPTSMDVQGEKTGLAQLEFHGEIVGSGNRIEGDPRELADYRNIRARLTAAQPQEPLPCVLDIVRGQPATIHRRLVVPEDIIADLEHVGERIRGLPALS